MFENVFLYMQVLIVGVNIVFVVKCCAKIWFVGNVCKCKLYNWLHSMLQVVFGNISHNDYSAMQ